MRIERLLGISEGRGGLAPEPKLRRQNRIQTVAATTAIEGNTLPLQHITAILDGKRVLGPAREIIEVKNAIRAYEAVTSLDPLSEAHMLRAHGLLMAELSADAGRYRCSTVGVLAGSRVAHVAPKAARVPALMAALFEFLREDAETPPLVKACVFHYEVEFIHPFVDGNGRLGRLWQHALFIRHSAMLAHVPTESVIKDHQQAYYSALALSDRAGDSTVFVTFMLEQLHTALQRFVAQVKPERPSGLARVQAAAAHFGERWFSRRHYLALYPGLSPATASRDLKTGTDQGILRVKGDKATARYLFKRSGARKRRRR